MALPDWLHDLSSMFGPAGAAAATIAWNKVRGFVEKLDEAHAKAIATAKVVEDLVIFRARAAPVIDEWPAVKQGLKLEVDTFKREVRDQLQWQEHTPTHGFPANPYRMPSRPDLQSAPHLLPPAGHAGHEEEKDASRDRWWRRELDGLKERYEELKERYSELRSDLVRERGARHALAKEQAEQWRKQADEWNELHRTIGRLEGELKSVLATSRKT
jgi:hypothetical protein